jgi:hypothetical protein
MDDDYHARIAAMRRDLTQLEQDTSDLRKKKASHDDFEVMSKRVSNFESEQREKTQNMQSDIHEIRRLVNSLIESVDTLSENLTRHKKEVSAPSASLNLNSVSLWERIPKWMYFLMGIGLLALLQQGPSLWTRFAGVPF